MFKVFNSKPVLLENTWAVEIVDELKPLPNEIVVQKRSNDCFNNTRLESVLEELGLEPGKSQIVVTGVATGTCVDCATVGFSVRDYHVYVPVDATATATELGEMLGFNHFFGAGYSYNVTPTRSDLVTLELYIYQAS